MPRLVSEHSKIHQAEQHPWEGFPVVCSEPISERVSQGDMVAPTKLFCSLKGMWQLCHYCRNVTLTASLWSSVLQVLIVSVHFLEFPWILMRMANVTAAFLYPGQTFL